MYVCLYVPIYLQYRHLIHAPVDRIRCHKSNPSTAINHVVYESKLRRIVRSSMRLCPDNWVAIGRAVVFYARAAHACSAGIKCRHCIYQNI